MVKWIKGIPKSSGCINYFRFSIAGCRFLFQRPSIGFHVWLSAKLFYNIVILVENDDLRLEFFCFFGRKKTEAEDDNDIFFLNQPGCRSENYDLTGTGLGGNDVGLQPVAIVQIGYQDRLVWYNSRRFHQCRVNCYAARVVQLRLISPCTMQLV